MNHFKLRGFSLIELLAVVTIIAILAGAGFVSYGVIKKNSRDTIRKSDLTAIRSALEQYRSIIGSYPADVLTLVPNYLPKEPKDPKSSCSYQYTSASPYKTYTVCADTEAVDSVTCTPSSCDGCTYNECLSQLQ